ncbi:FAD/NAD(P)-binding domain-containing protein [Apiospora aurea]|uniref:FAD/NAD(P)-binding domain-containing protein n=1 Tax=Apiospora aurea TaxID=335848 RepID=A0ABR1Q595_9PEZI
MSVNLSCVFGIYHDVPELQPGEQILCQPVAEDLLPPFGQFMKKHGLTDMAQTLFDFGPNHAPLLGIPAVYTLWCLDAHELQSLPSDWCIVAANGDSAPATLYRNAAAFLGDRLLYGVERHAHPAPLLHFLSSPSPRPRDHRGRQLHTPAPTPSAPRSSSSRPRPRSTTCARRAWASAPRKLTCSARCPRAFSTPSSSGGTGVVDAANVRNRYPANPCGFPDHPSMYSVIPLPKIRRLPASLRGNVTAVPKAVSMTAHTCTFMAPVKDFKGGFYDKLEGLLGPRNTWYIGAAWATQSSTTI